MYWGVQVQFVAFEIKSNHFIISVSKTPATSEGLIFFGNVDDHVVIDSFTLEYLSHLFEIRSLRTLISEFRVWTHSC